MSLSVDICIIGAGPVGGTLACRLANAGLTVALVDQAPLPPMEHPAFDGRAYAIAAGSRAVLEDAGLWDRLDVKPNPIRDIRVSDGRPGRQASGLHLHFNHDHVSPGAGPFGWMVEARALRKALNARFPVQPGLLVFAPAQATVERSQDGATIRLSTGETIQSHLVIACDGRNSPLRNQAGIQTTQIPYRQTAIVCAVAHERPHNDVALEHFLPAGPFALLPLAATPDALPEGAAGVSAIVWTERSADAPRFLALDNTLFAREIRRRLGTHFGELTPVGRRWSYPISAMIVHRYTAVRMALVGDSAHGIHPIAGQGLNLGLRDCAALSDLIIAAASAGADVGSSVVLDGYQRARQPDNLLMFTMTDGLDRLFSTDHRLVRSVRDIGLQGVNRLGRAKRLFARQAMGVASTF